MRVAKVTLEVRNEIHDKLINLPTNETHINVVQDCIFNYILSMEEITAYNQQYPNPVEYEEIDWCPPCVDEESGDQIPCE